MILTKGFRSRIVQIGQLSMGGSEKIRIQSMTNTRTMDTESSYNQIMELHEAGCELVRLTARNLKEADNLAVIRTRLENQGVYIPLAADIHFNPRIAQLAASIVHKIRINPGNYLDRQYFLSKDKGLMPSHTDIDEVRDSIRLLTDICRNNNTVIRVGVNHGSLSERILMQFGNTAEGMVASAMEFLELCRDADFHELVVSMKSSHVPTMIKANIQVVEAMTEAGMDYPIHLGVTEAGEGEDGRIKSAAGIGPLLQYGIGDTIRVSLTEDPVAEIPIARKLADMYAAYRTKDGDQESNNHTFLEVHTTDPEPGILGGIHAKAVVGDFTGSKDILRKPDLMPVSEGQLADSRGCRYHYSVVSSSDLSVEDNIPSPLIIKLRYTENDPEKLLLQSASDISILVLKKTGDGYWLENNIGDKVSLHPDIVFGVLQATGARITGTEYISCPSCGRTTFDIQGTLKKIKENTQGLNNVKIAVMGCIVNGPGEMADADYGYVGEGSGRITLYHSGKAVKKNIDEKDAIRELLKLINSKTT